MKNENDKAIWASLPSADKSVHWKHPMTITLPQFIVLFTETIII